MNSVSWEEKSKLSMYSKQELNKLEPRVVQEAIMRVLVLVIKICF